MHHFSCCFCAGNLFDIISSNANHKVKKDHGPFSIYKCLGCDSLITYPLPSAQQLEDLYHSFEGGIEPRLRQMRSKTPLTQWYTDCINNARHYNNEAFERTNFKWMDVGAGAGELSEILSQKFTSSEGVAVDFSEEPDQFKVQKLFKWYKRDLNGPNWIDTLPERKFDVIFALAVLEHVLSPDKFLQQLINSLSKGGILYVLTPDFASPLSRMLGTRWPYYLPGEHLHIPTIRGLSKWFQKIQQESNNAYKARVETAQIHYPIQYILRFMHLNSIAGFFSKKATVKVKPGLLQLIITRRK